MSAPELKPAQVVSKVVRRAVAFQMLLLAFVLGALPDAAVAASWSGSGSMPAGALLSGKGAAWLVGLRGGGVALYRAGRGQRPRRIHRFPAPQRPAGADSAVYAGGAFGASATGLAVETQQVFGSSNGQIASFDESPTEFFFGRVDGPLASFERCSFPVGTSLGDLDLSGRTLAFERCDRTVEVSNVPGRTAPFVVGADVHAVRLAGHFLALLEGAYELGQPAASRADLVVYDIRTGAELYRLPARLYGGYTTSYSVDTGGRVALTYDPRPSDRDARQRVAWASPSDAKLHRLPLAARLGYVVKIASARIAFARDDARGRTSRREVGVTDLAGDSHLIARRVQGVDFDGKRVAYVRRLCTGFRVVVIRASTRARGKASPCARHQR